MSYTTQKEQLIIQNLYSSKNFAVSLSPGNLFLTKFVYHERERIQAQFKLIDRYSEDTNMTVSGRQESPAFSNLPLESVSIRTALHPDVLVNQSDFKFRRLVYDKLAERLEIAKLGSSNIDLDAHETDKYSIPPGATSFTPHASIVFVKEDVGLEMRLQNDSISVYWRNEYGTPYVGFASLKSALDSFIESVNHAHSFGGESVAPVQLSAVNITYRNEVVSAPEGEEAGSAWYLRNIFQNELHDSPKKVTQTVLGWEEESGIDYLIDVKSLIRVSTKENYSQLVTSAGYFITHGPWTLHLERCHEDLNRLFLKILNDRAKHFFGLKNS